MTEGRIRELLVNTLAYIAENEADSEEEFNAITQRIGFTEDELKETFLWDAQA